MTERVEQWICIKFCVKLEHSSKETTQIIQKAAAMDNWWLAASSRQHAHSCIKSPADFFLAKHQIIQVTQPRYSPDLVPCNFWLFPKLNMHRLWKRRDFRPSVRLGKYDEEAGGDWENCVRFQGAYFEGDWGIIVLCTMFLVFCIFFNNVSIFHIAWLDTFWTNLMYL